MKILFSGGGTIGSVSPLLAVFEQIKAEQPSAQFLWLATKTGPEDELIASYSIPVNKIFSGKFRRYFSVKNFVDPLLVMLGFFQAFFVILKFKPDITVSAGGFVSVPVIWAAKILKVKSLIHQQDVVPGLANLLMSRLTDKITVTFEKSVADFFSQKTVWVGNPVRQDILAGSKEEANKIFKLEAGLPTILVIGGGTGALRFNQLIADSIDSLVNFCQVIHLTGNRAVEVKSQPRYHAYKFLNQELKHAYAAADLVISRAGMSVLTELSALKKPSVIIPIANSHQEENASAFFKNNAVVLIKEENLDPAGFSVAIKELIVNQVELNNLSNNIGKVLPINANAKMAEIISKMIWTPSR